MDQKSKRARDEEEDEELSEEEEEEILDEEEDEEAETIGEEETIGEDEETADVTENADDITESEISDEEPFSDEESDEETVVASKPKQQAKVEASRNIIRRLKNYTPALPPAKNELARATKIISVVDEFQATRNIISHTEKAKLIATRAGQIEAGSAPFVSIEGKLTATEIAELEWRMQKFPLSILRETASKNEMRDGEMTTVIYYEIIDPMTCIIP